MMFFTGRIYASGAYEMSGQKRGHLSKSSIKKITKHIESDFKALNLEEW
jgi:hypothetical protein